MFTQRPHRTLLHTLLALIIINACSISQKTTKSTQPNFILIFLDDAGYADFSCYGATGYTTPNIDQLAREGARCTNYYTSQPVCTAARASILTGCYADRLGVHHAFMPSAKTGLNPEEITIAEMLKAKGYATAIYGKWHLGDSLPFMPNAQGFDDYYGIPYSNDMWPKHPQQGPVFQFPPLPLFQNTQRIGTLQDQSNLTSEITERAVQFIQKHKSNPYFLYVPHPQPHVPLHVNDQFRGKSGAGLYADVMLELDWSVGQIVQAVKDAGQEENTCIILTSDNGPWLVYGNHAGNATPLREGKGSTWEGGVCVPCIVKFPGRVTAGSEIATPFMSIDWLPTIADYTQAQLPKQPIDGQGVATLFAGKTENAPHKTLFFYYNTNELQAARMGDWKLMLPHTFRSKGTPGKDGKPGASTMVEIKQPMLYHLPTDPSESTDLAEKNPLILQEILQEVERMRHELGDILTGVKGVGKRAYVKE